MDKLILVDGTEHTLTNSVAGTNSLTVTVVTDDFTALRQALTRDNLAEVSIYTNDALSGLYEGYTQVSPYIVNGSEITFTFTKEDEVQARLTEIENNITNNELALVEIYEMMLGGTEE